MRRFIRRMFVILLTTFALALATAAPASATSTNTGYTGVPYNTKTNAFGLVQCANYYVELGEALANNYLYVRVTSWRTKEAFCNSTNAYTGDANAVARVGYALYAKSIYGVYYECRNWTSAVGNPGGSHVAEIYEIFVGCGDTYYYVQSYHQVAMDPGNGQFYWYNTYAFAPGYTASIWLNG